MHVLAAIALTVLSASSAQRPARRDVSRGVEVTTPSVSVEYQRPRDPAHERLYLEMRQRRVLEHVAEAAAVFRLPKPLKLVFQGCDGDSNAFYQPETARIIFCYEYLADIERAATSMMGGKPPEDAVDGPVVFLLFHEGAHAVFDLLQVPVLGREEDAADFFAAFTLLRMGDEMCLRMLKGAAWAYRDVKKDVPLDVSDFSDVHSLDAQRYYNILCLAYGSDPRLFATAVTSGNLPEERAETCASEFRQVLYAVQKLILPSVDARKLDRLLVKHHARKIDRRPPRSEPCAETPPRAR